VRLVLFALVGVLLLIGTASAGSLGKYSDEPLAAPAIQQQLSPSEIKQRLNKKMTQAIHLLNNMDQAKKQKWIQHYLRKYQEARENKNYLEAAYYQGILSGVE
jgi:hypothetical protein